MIRRWWLIAAVILIGCSHDCLYYPCAAQLAIEVTVTAEGSTVPPANLAIGWATNPPQTSACDAKGVCRILGGTGQYDITLTAQGYQTQQLHATVTGQDAGCNTCGHIDVQKINAVMKAQ